MRRRRFNPALNKKYLGTFSGYDVFSVNAFAIRNVAQPDEEFDSFSTHDEFPDLIPEHDIWISAKSVRQEGEFFIANAIRRLDELAKGSSEDQAYSAGLNTERQLRAKRTGVEYRDGRPHKRIPTRIYQRHFVTLDDVRFPIEVWIVDGSLVRSSYKTDYTEGGHGYVYRWCPKNQIWVEKDIDMQELPYIITHEYIELRLMREEKLPYDRAHEICSEMEFDLRQSKRRRRFPGLSTRKYQKTDLNKITTEEFFACVKRHYVHNLMRRARALISDAASKVLP